MLFLWGITGMMPLLGSQLILGRVCYETFLYASQLLFKPLTQQVSKTRVQLARIQKESYLISLALSKFLLCLYFPPYNSLLFCYTNIPVFNFLLYWAWGWGKRLEPYLAVFMDYSWLCARSDLWRSYAPAMQVPFHLFSPAHSPVFNGFQ